MPRPARATAAAIACLVLAACAAAPEQRAADPYEDGLITTRVKRALFEQPGVPLSGVEVQTEGGRVQLSGFVPDEHALRAAEEAARRVQGVQAVQNNLRLR
ncbi:MAG TPA: BON domain-containing protein [Burkholderiales bacterium]|nr:BON domain-containing protein [Burkholderiales bacterium]